MKKLNRTYSFNEVEAYKTCNCECGCYCACGAIRGGKQLQASIQSETMDRTTSTSESNDAKD